MEFQNLKFTFYSILFQYGSNNLLMAICFAVAIFYFMSVSSTLKDKLKCVALISLTSVACFFGARILHVLIENPNLLKTPELIFTRFDGMTFNGSILFGFATFFFAVKIFAKEQRAKYWDQLAFMGAFSYGMIRIGCFAAGCCWGTVSAVPWSVKYTDSIFMPWLGIPVHPVQLYDSLLGFSIFAILHILNHKYKNFHGKLFPIFLALYAIGRFITEYFRGDSFRGEKIALYFSTSQIVSIVIIFILILQYYMQKRKITTLSVVGIASLFFVGCLPQPITDAEFRSVKRLEHYEIYQTKKPSHLQKKNVLFLAGDDNIQIGFANSLKAAYKTETPPRLEDISFWEYTKNLKDIYNIIVRVPSNKVGYLAMSAGLKYLESLGQPYDLILLTHGMANHLSTGTGYFFSYRELAELKGQLPQMNLVLLQSCFGKSLVQDFKDAGAKYVMSYPDFNRNFFFYGFFLKFYYPGTSVEDAYTLAKNSFEFQMTTAPYFLVADILLINENKISVEQGRSPISKSQFVKNMIIPNLD